MNNLLLKILTENIPTIGLDKLTPKAKLSLEVVAEEYYKNAIEDAISCVGMNPGYKYVYIELENGVSISSKNGLAPEYSVYDVKENEEHIFETYGLAQLKQEQLNNK